MNCYLTTNQPLYQRLELIPMLLLSILLLCQPSISLADDILSPYPELKAAGVLVESAGSNIIAANHNTPFIPASTTKLVTAWLALQHWGESYHFKTNFYFDDQSNVLWVKGGGDPFITSEELRLIATNLKQRGLTKVSAIGIDSSLFQTDLITPGSDYSNNPYDAIPSAIAANFNTIAVLKKNEKLVSAEKQTPLTPTAIHIASQHTVTNKRLRVNTGKSAQVTEHYFAELLAYFLREQGIQVSKQVIWGIVPNQTAFYTHENSKSLGQIIQPMLKYSTNFIANQLVLVLSADYFKRPANFGDVQRYMEMNIHKQFAWKNVTLKDGAGLSRDNRLSPQQLVDLLNVFMPWKHLLPEVESGLYAKSGTLNNISTLAGYRVDSNNNWNAFALMMTRPVYHKRRNAIAKAITTP